MSLAAMLNPAEDQGLPSPAMTRATSEATPEPAPVAKKQKLAKDAPIFAKGSPVGHVKYAPYEAFAGSEREVMNRFNVFPDIGTITNFPRHIPYSSDKKGFLQKTGRDAFEGMHPFLTDVSCSRSPTAVFQYTFQLPSQDRVHTVMWDYNIGLVRITPFFKCCNMAKVCSLITLASFLQPDRCTDSTRKDVGIKPGSEGSLPQHYGRSVGCTG